MTSIQEAAEERYPYWLAPESHDHPDADDWSSVDASWQNADADDRRAAFIAGAKWALERAERLAYEQQAPHSEYQGMGNCGACACAIVAATIRSLSTTTAKEESNG